MIKIAAAVAAGLSAAFTASLCCLGPLLAVSGGIGGAGLAGAFEPLRPYLLLVSATLFVVGGLALYRRPGETVCHQQDSCVAPRLRARKVLSWTAVGIAAALATFPSWSKLLV
ncbi:MAG: mercuric transporter MerT family protein [Gemmatimonadota bacterium]